MPPRSRNAHAWAEILGPGVGLAQQLDESPTGSDSSTSPPKALMLAVLKDAIRCFQEDLGYARARARILARQAEQWIRRRDWSSPFSFNSICDTLGIDPDCMREALLRMKYERLRAEHVARTRPEDPHQARRVSIARLAPRARSAKR